MGVIHEQVRAKSRIDGQDERQVLNLLAREKNVMLETIVNQFPGIRWGDLFVILGRLRREGLMTVHQVGSQMELRINKQAGTGF